MTKYIGQTIHWLRCNGATTSWKDVSLNARSNRRARTMNTSCQSMWFHWSMLYLTIPNDYIVTESEREKFVCYIIERKSPALLLHFIEKNFCMFCNNVHNLKKKKHSIQNTRIDIRMCDVIFSRICDHQWIHKD